jgi:rod shape determining protein RodA
MASPARNTLSWLTQARDDVAAYARVTDWTQVVAILALCVAGYFSIQSAGDLRGSDYHTQQLLFMVVGWGAYWALASVDYRELRRFARWIYLAGLALLLPIFACAVVGADLGSVIRSVYGARRWINLGLFSIQPSELAKVTTLILLAAFLARSHVGRLRDSWGALLGVAGIAFAPFFLIFMQPDLGSALIFVPLAAALLHAANLSRRFFVAVGLVLGLFLALVAVDLSAYSDRVRARVESHPEDRNPTASIRGQHDAEAWFVLLKDYQRERILAFLAPELADPRGVGASWQVRQALIAVGRGGLTGQGYNEGMQARLGFLPEGAAHNDFVFSGFAEEHGLAGSLALVTTFGLLLWRVLRTGLRAADRFGAFLSVGAAAILFAHVFINMGMNLNLMPVTGVPLPFLSYGGSFILSCFLLMGLVQSVHRHSPGGQGGGLPATA